MLTWKQFKEKLEKEGVKDDDVIGFIDIDGIPEVKVTRTPFMDPNKKIYIFDVT